jgi:hypothetical protein
MHLTSALLKKAMHVFHGGDLDSGRRPLVTYWTTSREMAETYVDMTEDRHGVPGKVYEKDVNFGKLATWDDVRRAAERVKVYSNEDLDMYTPASVFDAEIHGEYAVAQLVGLLKHWGFQGAGPLPDIAYGKNREADAYIQFN